MDFGKLWDLISFALSAISDGKVSEQEIVTLVEKILMLAASLKGKPMQEADAHNVAVGLVALYKLFN